MICANIAIIRNKTNTSPNLIYITLLQYIKNDSQENNKIKKTQITPMTKS